MIAFTATVKAWSQGEADKNGKMPLVLVPISGVSPRGLNVISGTSAELQGFKEGTVHAVTATEREVTPENEQYGRQFNFSSIGTLSPLEALRDAKENPLNIIIKPAAVEANAPAVPVAVEA